MVSGLLTLFDTMLQISLEYRDDLQQVASATEQVVAQSVQSVEESLRKNDVSRVVQQLGKVSSQDDIVYAAVRIGDRVMLAQGHRAEKGFTTIIPLQIGQSFKAVLEVDADLVRIRNKEEKRFVRMFVTNGIKNFLVAAFLLLMVQYLVTRHLGALAGQLGDIDLSKAKEPIHLNRTAGIIGDELDQVVAGLNGMQQRARDAFERLERNEQQLLLFFDSTEEAILGVDREEGCTFVNDNCLKMIGNASYEQTIGHHLHDLFVFSPADSLRKPMDECLVCRAMETGLSQQDEEGSILLANGARLSVVIRTYPVFYEGETTGALVFMTDNSQTRALKQEMKLLSEAVKQVPILIVIADRHDRILYVNPVTERITGFGRDELLGKAFRSFRGMFQGEQNSTGDIESFISAGKKWEGIIETPSKWGTPLKFYAIISPIVDDSGKVVSTITVAREVSYEIGLQDELIQAKKMEAVGRLSASFAHEFGNPLFGVRAVLRDFLGRDNRNEEERQLLEMAMDECNRMRDMIRKFQELYKDTSAEEEITTIEEIIQQIITDVKPLMENGAVHCSLGISDEAETVMGDRAKLTLAIRNVMVNGIESMTPGGGQLAISATLEGRFLVVQVGDDGGGIREEHSELIFEPFFSTKPEVEGAGLGLPVAYGTIKSLGGNIIFSSQPGRGTIFSLYIPT